MPHELTPDQLDRLERQYPLLLRIHSGNGTSTNTEENAGF